MDVYLSDNYTELNGTLWVTFNITENKTNDELLSDLGNIFEISMSKASYLYNSRKK